MKELLSPKQVATSIGVSESSLKRWCDQGVITTERTPGGHRRIRVGEVIRFLRQQNHPLVRPEVLGLPSGAGERPQALAEAREALFEALTRGDSEQSRRLVIDSFLSGGSVVSICQDLITPVLHSLGDEWECGMVEIFQEHRACEIVNRLMYDLRSVLPPPAPAAPLAMGGTPPGDVYRIANLMVELILVDEGWEAVSLGSSLPFPTMASAARQHEPRLFWMSFTHVEDHERTRHGFQEFLENTPATMRVAIGGQGVVESLSDLCDGQRVCCCGDLHEFRSTIEAWRAVDPADE
ncbi:B12-binding domain-containing protein [Botrimarina sp.]|uniref:B12-binding domain-containing protein n=1 Tax=Botrimarina sp. TaxID=2795802 RepID=UPI0032EF32B1